MTHEHLVHHHQPSLVVLSIAIAALASYTALDLAARFRAATGPARRAWLATAALAMGGGIWSMHFIAMLALQIDLPVAYDASTTLLSLAVAIVVAAGGFWFLQPIGASLVDILAGGTLMGLGIAAMHYTGMAALRLPAQIRYDPSLVAASVGIAIAAATVALTLAAREQGLIKKALSGLVMGGAIAGMHFTGMAAVTFAPTRQPLAIPEPALSRPLLAILVAFAAATLLALALASSIIDQRLAASARREHALRQAKLQAELASRAKSDFLALMSHELRTPLNAVIGFAELMRDEMFGELGSDRYRIYVRDIHAAGVHLLTLINDMLDLSKAEAGRLELDDAPIDVANVIGRSLAMIRTRAENADVSLKLQVSEDLPSVVADELRVRQIMLNLLSNAIKFTPRGGRVVVDVAIDRAGLVIAVRDTGMGVSEQDMERIFTPFVQVDDLYTRKKEGTGLGLPLTKRLVELHGGRLEIASAVGQGTTLTVRFPRERIVDAHPPTAPASGRAVA